MKKRRLILFLLAAGMVISGLPYRNLQAAEKEELTGSDAAVVWLTAKPHPRICTGEALPRTVL